MGQFTLGEVAEGSRVPVRLVAGGVDEAEAVAKRELFARCAGALLGAGHAPEEPAVAIFVPGRIEVFGKHTDYCGGRSLLCATGRGLCFVAAGRGDGLVRFHALDAGESAEYSLGGDIAPVAGHWSTYPANAVRRFSRNFPGISAGAEIAMSSDLPRASGLSSSSAIIIGTFLSIARLGQLERAEAYGRHLATPEALAGYLGTVENGQGFGPLEGDSGVGTFGGSQDHTAVLCCRPGRVSLYSFCPVTRRGDVELPEDLTFVVADSGVVAEKTGSALEKYNGVAARAADVLAAWREAGGTAASLNDVISLGEGATRALRAAVSQRRAGVAADLHARLEQFVTESNVLIPGATRALLEGDLGAFGELASVSHGLADTHLRNQTPETNALQRALRKSGAVGASAFGAGFGGSVWGLFDPAGLEVWRNSEAGKRYAWFATRPGPAAFEL